MFWHQHPSEASRYLNSGNNNNNIYLFAKRTNINFIIHTHGNVKENQNMCEGRGHRRTYVIKSSALTSSTVKNKIYIYNN